VPRNLFPSTSKGLLNVRVRRSRRLLVLAAAIAALNCRAGGGLERPGGDAFVADAAGVIEPVSAQRMNELLGALLADADIEFIAVSANSLNGQAITGYTNELFERWKVGGRTGGNRGLLLVIAKQEEQVRLEVAYELEGIFTDAFVSYVEHEQMVPYFERGLVGDGVEATVELIAGRIFERIRGLTYDPNREGPEEIGGYRSGGGGADVAVPLAGGPAPSVQSAGDEVRAYFAAQPSAEAAWQRFLELNRRRIKDTDLGLYDDAAKKLVRRINSNAGQDHLAQLYAGKNHTIRVEGDRAAVIFLDDPDHLFAPWFFHRTAAGWQLDGSMYPAMISYNHRNQWRFRRLDHAYMFAFSDFRFDRNGFAFRKRK
jgi:hypothetical protein